jgi:hypothetical protein
MKQEIIKDKFGNKHAVLETNGDTTVLFDKYHVRIAEYNSRENITWDKYHVKIGSGNLLMTLLPK